MCGKYTEKDVAIKLLECRDLMDFFDDGHHIKEYFYLVEMSNELFLMLSESNQKAFQKWIEKKIQKEIEEA